MQHYQTAIVCRQPPSVYKITDSHINCETPTTSTLLRTRALMFRWGPGSSVSDWIRAAQQQFDPRKVFPLRHQVQTGSVVLSLVPELGCRGKVST